MWDDAAVRASSSLSYKDEQNNRFIQKQMVMIDWDLLTTSSIHKPPPDFSDLVVEKRTAITERSLCISRPIQGWTNARSEAKTLRRPKHSPFDLK